MNFNKRLFFMIANSLILVIFSAGVCGAEVKLDYRQRQAVKRQEWNMKDVEKKISTGISGTEIKWTLNKLDAIIADLTRNNCPTENSQVASIMERVAKARIALGGTETASELVSSTTDKIKPQNIENKVLKEKEMKQQPALSPASGSAVPAAEAKLPYNVREALKRQERNLADFEKKVAEGRTGPTSSQLDAMLADLRHNHAPENHSKIKNFMARVEKARIAFAAAPVPLNRNAKKAVKHQKARLLEITATIDQLEKDIKAAPVIKRWDDRGISSALSGVEDDLNRNQTPTNHPDYLKIIKDKTSILARLETLKSLAQPKIDAYSNSVNMNNFPDVYKDLERTDDLATLYNNVNISNLKKSTRTKKLLGLADQIEKFITETRIKYAPLIENNIQPGRSLNYKLNWLNDNFNEFKKVQLDFNQQVPGEIRDMLTNAENSMSVAVQKKNPQIFSGGVSQAMKEARELLESLKLSVGQDGPVVAELSRAIAATQEKYNQTAKALEEDILAETRAPEDKYEGSDRNRLIKKIRSAWHKENPADEIIDIRIVTPAWERSIGWDYNAAGVWYKTDKQFLGFTVIVKTDAKIATLYPAFINRDNLKKKDTTVTSHKSTYVIRRMLIKNVEK